MNLATSGLGPLPCFHFSTASTHSVLAMSTICCDGSIFICRASLLISSSRPSLLGSCDTLAADLPESGDHRSIGFLCAAGGPDHRLQRCDLGHGSPQNAAE